MGRALRPVLVTVVDVYLDDVLPVGVENAGPLPNGILRAQLGPHNYHRIRIAHRAVGGRLTVDAHHAHRQRVSLGDRALSFIAGGHRHVPQFG